ncbi:hypothetical protein PB1_17234 [Bacillus methanolicus PB1]|uniref:Uncharacterized protein n=1 Tax=Bacillus methanolicus PB1 TaxID=997296 RepID=I3DYK1_BACMT|nr:hypothetical protein PB1_17234 [Bacillus methanolicus PB1]
MPFIQLENDVELYYKDSGSRTPVIFIRGFWMSSRFYYKQ